MCDKKKSYWILAFYQFTPVEDPRGEVEAHKAFFLNREITSRIYISEEGINGQMSAQEEAAKEYIEWLKTRPSFANTKIKIDYWHEQVFPRQTVKYRKKLVGTDEEIDLSLAAEHLSPKQWKEKLDNEKDKHLIIDVRNDYETEIGHFEGAELPPCKTFREFSEYADTLSKETPVMMYCTGGIRCELYSALLRKKGIENIYQLDGGVINYGHEVGSDHWKGKLFVFDDRMAVPISDEELPPIAKCHHCSVSVDNLYNCANMDCNNLFISCPNCLKEFEGCCQAECKSAPRLRSYAQQNPHKPFRRQSELNKANLA